MRYPLYFLGLIAFLVPITTLAPQYRAPQPIEAIPASVSRVDADYGNIHLIGYEAVDRRYFPGEVVRLTFYWQVEAQTEADLSVGITLVSPTGDRLGGIDTYPGAGTLRTSTWEAGKIYADTYQIPLSRAITARYPFAVQIHWYDESPEEILPMTTSDGATIPDVVLNVGAVIDPNQKLPANHFTSVERLRADEDGNTLVQPTERDFENKIYINGFVIDPRSFTVDVLWEVRSNLEADYTAFLHVVNSAGELVGQADVFPTLPTRYWRFGELYITSHHIQFFDGEGELPFGDYTVQVGWYINDGETYPRLVIPPTNEEEQERTYFELMTFTKLDNRIYQWREYEDAEATGTESPIADPNPEATQDAGRFTTIDLDVTEETDPMLDDFFDDEGTAEPDAEETGIVEEAATAAPDEEVTETATEESDE